MFHGRFGIVFHEQMFYNWRKLIVDWADTWRSVFPLRVGLFLYHMWGPMVFDPPQTPEYFNINVFLILQPTGYNRA